MNPRSQMKSNAVPIYNPFKLQCNSAIPTSVITTPRPQRQVFCSTNIFLITAWTTIFQVPRMSLQFSSTVFVWDFASPRLTKPRLSYLLELRNCSKATADLITAMFLSTFRETTEPLFVFWHRHKSCKFTHNFRITLKCNKFS